MTINSYKDLIVWQKSVDLSVNIYQITNAFPKSEIFGLTNQMRRCAISIPSNIAEGQKRGTRKEYIQFLRVAYASGAEMETQLLISSKIGFLSLKDGELLSNSLEEIMKMLNKLIKSLNDITKT